MSCNNWKPRDPFNTPCGVLGWGYQPIRGAYCCNLIAEEVANKFFPPYQEPDLLAIKRDCCKKEWDYVAPLSYEVFLAKKNLGIY